jgi:hypothetical protein
MVDDDVRGPVPRTARHTVPGPTTIEWFGESLLVVGSVFRGGRHVHSEMSLVLGRSDPNDQFVALYQDDRDVCRHYAMTFDAGTGP